MSDADIKKLMACLSTAKNTFLQSQYDSQHDALILHYVYELRCIEMFMHNNFGAKIMDYDPDDVEVSVHGYYPD